MIIGSLEINSLIFRVSPPFLKSSVESDQYLSVKKLSEDKKKNPEGLKGEIHRGRNNSFTHNSEEKIGHWVEHANWYFFSSVAKLAALMPSNRG